MRSLRATLSSLLCLIALSAAPTASGSSATAAAAAASPSSSTNPAPPPLATARDELTPEELAVLQENARESRGAMRFFHFLYPWGFIIQLLAGIHWLRRRPEVFWLWLIVIGGPIGAIVYTFAEIIPDFDIFRIWLQRFPRKRRIRAAEIEARHSPTAGKCEELADLLFEDRQFEKAREYYSRSIASRVDSFHPFYYRALCSIERGQFGQAIPDLERVIDADPKYDYKRAAGLLALSYDRTGEDERAGSLYASVAEISSLTETLCNYAAFLARRGEVDEARRLAEQVVERKVTSPRFLRRRERKWYRRAGSILRQLKRSRG